jgi:hypothetical protein
MPDHSYPKKREAILVQEAIVVEWRPSCTATSPNKGGGAILVEAAVVPPPLFVQLQLQEGVGATGVV